MVEYCKKEAMHMKMEILAAVLLPFLGTVIGAAFVFFMKLNIGANQKKGGGGGGRKKNRTSIILFLRFLFFLFPLLPPPPLYLYTIYIYLYNFFKKIFPPDGGF